MAVSTQALRIQQAGSADDIDRVRELFLEYAGWLGFSLCFQGFDKELTELPGDYAPPQGRLLIAWSDDKPAGCVALHALHSPHVEPPTFQSRCEMKRLYVRPEYRGQSVGKKLLDAVIADAKGIGYSHMLLDTVAGKMDAAIAMYRACGFTEIPSYRALPVPGALYMQLDLTTNKPDSA